PEAGAWTPYHVEDDMRDWPVVEASPAIAAGSALDVSFLVPAPAGPHRVVPGQDRRLGFREGGRGRVFRVRLPPAPAFVEPERADRLAERLARSGVNLVRLGDLEMPLGLGLSLLDDSRDDTKAFDPEALAKLDHLIAALKGRGISIALELQGNRRF